MSKVVGDGVIYKSVQYSVWCVTCDYIEDFEPFKNKAEAAKSYRKIGWHKIKLGWQCIKCSGEK